MPGTNSKVIRNWSIIIFIDIGPEVDSCPKNIIIGKFNLWMGAKL